MSHGVHIRCGFGLVTKKHTLIQLCDPRAFTSAKYSKLFLIKFAIKFCLNTRGFFHLIVIVVYEENSLACLYIITMSDEY